jgi:hypothetical protein
VSVSQTFWSWIDWFTFSRRRSCHRSSLCAFHAYMCIALCVMVHDPCTLFQPAWLALPAEQVSRRLSPRLSPNSSRPVLHSIRDCELLWECQQFEPTTSTPIPFHSSSLQLACHFGLRVFGQIANAHHSRIARQRGRAELVGRSYLTLTRLFLSPREIERESIITC